MITTEEQAIECWKMMCVAMVMESWDTAIECCDEVLLWKRWPENRDPRLANLLSNKGIALGKIRRYGDAHACFDEALQLRPHDEEIWVNKGNCFARSGDSREALRCYSRAVELNPASGLAWHHKGIALSVTSPGTSEAAACERNARKYGYDAKSSGSMVASLPRRMRARKWWHWFKFWG